MPNLSVPTGRVEIQHQVLIKSDAGRVIETPIYIYDLGLPDKKELELHLSGDDASAIRWRIARKPDPLTLEWYAVDGQPAYETGDLIGDPSTAAKVLEFRGVAVGETAIVLELVERDPARRTSATAKRLEFHISVTNPISYSSRDGFY